MMGRDHGFTIIEVMLFLAISALLFLVAMTYMLTTIGNVRFQDSVKTTESFIHHQFSDVQSNSVTRPVWSDKAATCTAVTTSAISVNPSTDPDSSGNSGSCILLGVELVLKNVGTPSATTILSYPILGYAGASTSGGTIAALKAANPKILVIGSDGTTQPSETFILPWGATLARYKVAVTPQPVSPYNAIAILRSPGSESINLVFHRVSAVLENTNLTNAINDVAKTSRNIPAVICINRPGVNSLSGAIIFDGKPGSTNMSIGSITSRTVPTDEEVIPGSGLNCL